MGKKKCECPAGIPEWVVTYGDMMSLLLTFFILLAAFSELKRDHEYQKVVTAVKDAFGYSGGVGVLPVDDPPLRSLVQSLEELSKEKLNETTQSKANDESITGKTTTVTRVHEGLKFTVGGALTFKPGSAELMDGAKVELLRISKLFKGRNNKVEIRGHAARKTLPPSSPYRDLEDLSYYRAKAVRDFLIQEGGIRPILLKSAAMADTEPLSPRSYTEEEQAVNRRVEIIQTEALVEEFHPDAELTDEGFARGG